MGCGGSKVSPVGIPPHFVPVDRPYSKFGNQMQNMDHGGGGGGRSGNNRRHPPVSVYKLVW